MHRQELRRDRACSSPQAINPSSSRVSCPSTVAKTAASREHPAPSASAVTNSAAPAWASTSETPARSPSAATERQRGPGGCAFVQSVRTIRSACTASASASRAAPCITRIARSAHRRAIPSAATASPLLLAKRACAAIRFTASVETDGLAAPICSWINGDNAGSSAALSRRRTASAPFERKSMKMFEDCRLFRQPGNQRIHRRLAMVAGAIRPDQGGRELAGAVRRMPRTRARISSSKIVPSPLCRRYCRTGPDPAYARSSAASRVASTSSHRSGSDCGNHGVHHRKSFIPEWLMLR
jgi:hypothetical protein